MSDGDYAAGYTDGIGDCEKVYGKRIDELEAALRQIVAITTDGNVAQIANAALAPVRG
jgi:hypothetical protein